jgi:hypothetical protein
MSQPLGTNYYSELKCHNVTNHSNFSRIEYPIFEWTLNPSTLIRNVTVVNSLNTRFAGWMLCLGKNVELSVCGSGRCRFNYPKGLLRPWMCRLKITSGRKLTRILPRVCRDTWFFPFIR